MTGPRPCAPAGSRQYKSKYATIGHRILDLESEACGVPDSAYVLLDDLIEQSDKIQLGPKATAASAKRDQILRLNRGIAQILSKNGFALYIPVKTLADALVVNSPTREDKHLFDCDTGSFIYMSIAEHLGFQTSLVEITLPSGAGHNYVRWSVDATASIDWDANGQAECTTPKNLPPYQGISMSSDAVMSYVYLLRGSTWKGHGDFKHAREDYDKALTLSPNSPDPLNSIAWLNLTTKDLQTPAARKEAIDLATKAVSARRIPNFLDTLACAYAASGDFKSALKTEEEAIKGPTGGNLGDFESRRELFKRGQTCVGAK